MHITRARLCTRLLSRCHRHIWSGAHPVTARAAAAWMLNYEAKAPEERAAYIKKQLGSSGEVDRMIDALNRTTGSLSFVMKLRKDVNEWIKSPTKGPDDDLIRSIDLALRKWLSTFFSEDSTYVREVNFLNSSGAILEYIANGERVHSVQTVAELHRRVSGGRRCYSLFHFG